MSECSVCYHPWLTPTTLVVEPVVLPLETCATLVAEKFKATSQENALPRTTGWTSFVPHSTQMSLVTCAKNNATAFTQSSNNPLEALMLVRCFSRLSLGEQAWPKVLTCAKSVWQYKQLGVLPMSSPARKGAASNHKEHIIYSSHFKTSIGKIFLDLKRHCWQSPGKKIHMQLHRVIMI